MELQVYICVKFQFGSGKKIKQKNPQKSSAKSPAENAKIHLPTSSALTHQPDLLQEQGHQLLKNGEIVIKQTYKIHRKSIQKDVMSSHVLNFPESRIHGILPWGRFGCFFVMGKNNFSALQSSLLPLHQRASSSSSSASGGKMVRNGWWHTSHTTVVGGHTYRAQTHTP